jgi:nitroreductase
MHVHEALLTRRTIHRYASEPVPEAVIQRALLAAHHAPCHKLTWPWRFTLVGPTARAALAEIAVALKERSGPLPPAQRESVRDKILTPPVLIVASQVVDDDPMRAREDYAAVACALQNLQLSAHADGYGAKWSTGAVTTDEATHEVLGITAPERIVGFVWLGRAAQIPEIRRPPLHELVRRVP